MLLSGMPHWGRAPKALINSLSLGARALFAAHTVGELRIPLRTLIQK